MRVAVRVPLEGVMVRFTPPISTDTEVTTNEVVFRARPKVIVALVESLNLVPGATVSPWAMGMFSPRMMTTRMIAAHDFPSTRIPTLFPVFVQIVNGHR